MNDWIDVCRAGALAPGEHVITAVDGVSVVVFNVSGKFYALEDMCSHDDALLSDGMVDEGTVICPRHGASFCLRTGEALTPPAYGSVVTYPVRVENGTLQVGGPG